MNTLHSLAVSVTTVYTLMFNAFLISRFDAGPASPDTDRPSATPVWYHRAVSVLTFYLSLTVFICYLGVPRARHRPQCDARAVAVARREASARAPRRQLQASARTRASRKACCRWHLAASGQQVTLPALDERDPL